jgi:hypothetical protein
MTELRLRKEGLTWVETDGEIVALDTDASTYLSGNPAAAVLWPVLALGTTRPELVDALVGHFDIDRQTAKADVDAFLRDLEARNLLEET